MSSQRKMWWLRIVEKFLLFLILMFGGLRMLALVLDPATVTPPIWWVVLAIVIVLLIFLLFIQGQIDKLFNEVIALANFDTNAKFASLYERSPTAYLTIEPNGKVVAFNPAAVHLFNTTMRRITELNFFDAVLSHTGHDESVLRGKIKSGMTLIDEELSLQTDKGDTIWVLMSVYVDEFNRQRIISLIDTTQSKRVDTAKSEFVALATHQLRTPIAAIRWNVELLGKSIANTVDEKQARYLEKIDRNVLRMIALINDFLSVSKLEMGTFAAAEESVNLTEFFDSVIDEFSEKITQKNITVVRNEEPEQFVFLTDSRLFHIIVSNLVSNAVKYLQQDGTLHVRYLVLGSNLRIQIEDNGIGIPSAEQPQLFNKFFRASNAQSHQTEGTGLGLYIVEQSVEQLGGVITVESEENVKTVFTITLPTSKQ